MQSGHGFWEAFGRLLEGFWTVSGTEPDKSVAGDRKFNLKTFKKFKTESPISFSDLAVAVGPFSNDLTNALGFRCLSANGKHRGAFK